MDGFKTIDSSLAYIIYEVNIKNNYKSHCVFLSLSSAKQVKLYLQNTFKIQGSDIFVNKVIGFLDEKFIHCTNGFKYEVEKIRKNENLLQAE